MIRRTTLYTITICVVWTQACGTLIGAEKYGVDSLRDASGTGGTAATGGMTSTGGTVAAGGTSVSGGTTSTGGTAETGATAGAGGVTAAGGTTTGAGGSAGGASSLDGSSACATVTSPLPNCVTCMATSCVTQMDACFNAQGACACGAYGTNIGQANCMFDCLKNLMAAPTNKDACAVTCGALNFLALDANARAVIDCVAPPAVAPVCPCFVP